MHPERVGRVGHAPVRKGVCLQQVTEFIVHLGLRDVHAERQGCVEDKGQNAGEHHCQSGPIADPAQGSLDQP